MWRYSEGLASHAETTGDGNCVVFVDPGALTRQQSFWQHFDEMLATWRAFPLQNSSIKISNFTLKSGDDIRQGCICVSLNKSSFLMKYLVYCTILVDTC